MTGLLVSVIVLTAALGYTVTLLARRIAHLEDTVNHIRNMRRVGFYEAHGPNDPIDTAVARMWGSE